MSTIEPATMQPSTPGDDGFAVRLSGLRKDFKGTPAVTEFSLSMRKGELVCLLGPSGCGKTTTLRMVAGFIEPSGGTIDINGVDVTRDPPSRRDTGMVFQSYALFPHMTVADNIAFGLENVGMKPADRRRRVDEMLELIELGPLAGRLPRELSGGQQQRVALARALALRPAILLLDEPFSALDAQLRARMREDLRGLLDRVGITTLFVTHDQDEALVLSDRVVVMNAGHIEQIGTPGEIYEQPETRFVASFIGSCNFVDGEIDASGRFVSPSGITVRTQRSGRAAGPVTLMVRPENICWAPAIETSGAFAAVVEGVAYYGSNRRITLRVGGDRLVMECHPRDGIEVTRGGTVRVLIDPATTRLFDPAE